MLGFGIAVGYACGQELTKAIINSWQFCDKPGGNQNLTAIKVKPNSQTQGADSQDKDAETSAIVLENQLHEALD